MPLRKPPRQFSSRYISEAELSAWFVQSSIVAYFLRLSGKKELFKMQSRLAELWDQEHHVK